MKVLIIGSEQEPPDSYKAEFGIMHPHYQTTPIMEGLLKDAGHDVTVTMDAGILTSEEMKGYEVLVYNTTREGVLTLSMEERTALTQYIGGGGGFACIHYAGVMPKTWPQYHDVTGGGWIRETSTHQSYGEIAIDVANADHPCAQGITGFKTYDELYVKLGYKPDNDVFLTAEYDGQTWPMGWTRSYNKGRVFTTPLGHDAKSFEAPELRRLILNGVEWAGAAE